MEVARARCFSYDCGGWLPVVCYQWYLVRGPQAHQISHHSHKVYGCLWLNKVTCQVTTISPLYYAMKYIQKCKQDLY